MRKINKAIIILMLLCITVGCLSACSIGGKFVYKGDSKLINPNASTNTTALYEYLCDNYGKTVLSGQYINTFDDFTKDKFLDSSADKTSWNVFKTDELKAINEVTDDYPLVLGLDAAKIGLITDQSTIDFAEQWHNAGGIVTMCWHWFAPNREDSNRAFYTKETDFNLKKTLANPNSDDYRAMIAEIDLISEALTYLSDRDIPIMWRPLHEASGGWFWWGASGKDSYKQLYKIMYDRMTNYHKLNNLIWMANAQSTSWYVGDEYCDIISDDPYYPNSSKSAYKRNSANLARYSKCLNTTATKIIAMSENEFLPDIDTMFDKGAYWSMFATWCREYICIVDDSGATTSKYSEKFVSKDKLISTYMHDRVTTLKDHPTIYNI